MKNLALILDLRLMEQGWQQAHLYLLLQTYGRKVTGRNRDATGYSAALRFFYLKHFIRKTPQYDDSTHV